MGMCREPTRYVTFTHGDTDYEAKFVRIDDYGADADGRRGTWRWELDNVVNQTDEYEVDDPEILSLAITAFENE